MTSVEFLAMVAQLSVSILGFSGIVIAVGSRASGDLSAIDRVRLLGLLTESLIPLVIALVVMIVLTTATQGHGIWSACSAVYSAIVPVMFAVRLRHAFRTAGAEFTGRPLWVYVPVFIAIVLLQMLNAVCFDEFWPFAIALILHLVTSLVLFVRLLLDGFTRAA